MFNQAINDIIDHFKKIPGIGQKSAERYAIHLVKKGEAFQKDFAKNLETLHEKIFYCPDCQNFSNNGLCDICNNDKRNKKQICVVESPFDIPAIESASVYDGVYHVLHGVLSPIDGVGPNDLKIDELFSRINSQQSYELIFALSSTLEGGATIEYIKKSLPDNVKKTLLAQGISSGSIVEYTDELTLKSAIRNRQEL